MQNKQLVEKLLENSVQFGHKNSKYHPDMAPYIWGAKNGMHLIDLNKTAFLLEYACKQIEDVLSAGGQILWVGTKRQAQKAVAACARLLHHPYVIHRWIGGTLTNSDQVKKAVTKLLHMRDAVEKPLAHFKKKQISMLKKDLDRLEKNVSGITTLRSNLALMVVVDVKREFTAIKEASRCGVPIIGIADTNASTGSIDTIIPANDDSQKSIEFILTMLAEAAQRGVANFRAAHPEKAAKDDEKLVAQKLARLSASKDGSNEKGLDANGESKEHAPRGRSISQARHPRSGSSAQRNGQSRTGGRFSGSDRRGRPMSSGSAGSRVGSSAPSSPRTDVPKEPANKE